MEEPLQLLGRVFAQTGKQIRLGMFERPLKAVFEDDSVRILIERTWIKERRNVIIVTHTGVTLHVFTRNPRGKWDHDELTQQTEMTEQVWYAGANYRTDSDRLAQYQWENMCYRPGSSADPQDSAARQEQGYYK